MRNIIYHHPPAQGTALSNVDPQLQVSSQSPALSTAVGAHPRQPAAPSLRSSAFPSTSIQPRPVAGMMAPPHLPAVQLRTSPRAVS
ncbi:hypothetical protein JB92DRAFT_3036939 [Gautieria morchelliformis]|nr:hypothetical protein JB92DRAFT_3036939 [Gautieria morchelliformis]